jgi:hypothetical protein
MTITSVLETGEDDGVFFGKFTSLLEDKPVILWFPDKDALEEFCANVASSFPGFTIKMAEEGDE